MTLLHKLLRLPSGERQLVFEAAALLALAAAAVRVLPSSLFLRVLGSPRACNRTLFGQGPIDAIVQAVDRVAAHVPGTSCLVRALALRTLLARRGVASCVRIG